MHAPSTAWPGQPVILTVDHSNRSLLRFIALLQSHGVTQILDMRTMPCSRHNLQFNQDTLPAALQAVGIGYRHQPGLGGLRHPHPDFRNTGWRHASFRGFADYLQIPAFAAALEALLRPHRTVWPLCARKRCPGGVTGR